MPVDDRRSPSSSLDDAARRRVFVVAAIVLVAATVGIAAIPEVERQTADSSRDRGSVVAPATPTERVGDADASAPQRSADDGNASARQRTVDDGDASAPQRSADDGNASAPQRTADDGNASTPQRTADDGNANPPQRTADDGNANPPQRTADDGNANPPQRTADDGNANPPQRTADDGNANPPQRTVDDGDLGTSLNNRDTAIPADGSPTDARDAGIPRRRDKTPMRSLDAGDREAIVDQARAFLRAYLSYEIGATGRAVRTTIRRATTRTFARQLLRVRPRLAPEERPPRGRVVALELGDDPDAPTVGVAATIARSGRHSPLSMHFERERAGWRVSRIS